MTGCNGACCRNPFGVCSHKHQCDHHLALQAEAAKEQAWRDFINGSGPAPKPDRPASIVNRRTR